MRREIKEYKNVIPDVTKLDTKGKAKPCKCKRSVGVMMMSLLLLLAGGAAACGDTEAPKLTETPTSKPIATLTPTPKLTATPIPVSEATQAPEGQEVKGEYITFGHYEQDNNLSNGAEPIEWLVLAKEDNKALIISKYALDAVPYNEGGWKTTWEESTIRKWCNDDFYNAAFSTSEQQKILKTEVVNKDNPTSGTEGGNDTEDNVFFLSIEEAEKYFSDADSMCVKGTEYAEANEARIYDGVSAKYHGNVSWWLRTAGAYETCAAYIISNGGGVNHDGNGVGYGAYTARPALWLNLEP